MQLDHSVENEASCRAALAAGFEREGVRRGYLPLRDPTLPAAYAAPRRLPARLRRRLTPFTRRSGCGHRPVTPVPAWSAPCASPWSPRSSCPSTAPSAQVTREVVVAADRRAVTTSSSSPGARPGHVPRRPDVLGQPDDAGLGRARGDGAVPPRRVPPRRPAPARPEGGGGGRPARRTHRVAATPAPGSPASTSTDHHPGLRDEVLHDRWARVHSPDGGQLVVGYVGSLEKTKVIARLGQGRPAPRGPARRARRRPRRRPAARRGRQGDPSRDRPRARPLRGHLRRSACSRGRRRSTPRPCSRRWPAASRWWRSTAGPRPRRSATSTTVCSCGADRGGKSLARAVARLAASPDLRFALAGERATRSRTAPGTTRSPSCSTCTTPQPYAVPPSSLVCRYFPGTVAAS